MRKFNLNSGLLLLVIFLTLVNGCNSCKKDAKQEQTLKANLVENVRHHIIIEDLIIKYHVINLDNNNENMILGVIIEKEIDSKNITSSEIRQLIIDYKQK